MARKKDAQDDPQGVPDEVAEFMAKIFAEQAEEKARREQHYQEIMARVDQAREEEAQGTAPSWLAPKKREPRPKYDPDAVEAYLVELTTIFPGRGMEAEVENFRHRRRLFERLVAAREEAGLSQKEVAKRMGMPVAALERLELGDGNPYFSTIERYVAVLGKKIEWQIS